MGSQAPSVIPSSLGALFRHLLQMFAGVLISHGLIKEDQTSMLVAAGLFLVTFCWSIFNKRSVQQALQDAIDAPAGSDGRT